MNKDLRITLTSNSNGWLACRDGADDRALSSGEISGPWPLPVPTSGPTLTAGELRQALDRLEQNSAEVNDAEAVGRHLLACLLDPQLWPELNQASDGNPAAVVRIVLSTARDSMELQRLPWELLHDDIGFLGTRGAPPIVICREVGDDDEAVAETAPIQVDPAVLIIVGGSLTDRTLRPAAEYLALFDTLRLGNFDFRTHLVLDATLAEIRKNCAMHRPSIVHVIAHGDQDGGAGFLEMAPDEPQVNNGPIPSDPVRVNSEQLVSALQSGGATPPVLVLTACRTGGGLHLPVPETGGFVFQPSLAAECVARGVPVVAAMTGAITSDACREFTYGFYRALLTSQDIVVAAAEGRREAFLTAQSPRTEIDWAYPALFCRPGLTGVMVLRDSDGQVRRARLARDMLREFPSPVPFCGRHGVLDAFDRMLGSTDPAASRVLAIVQPDAYDQANAMGNSRTIIQLAANAIRSGYVVCHWRDTQVYEFKDFARALVYTASQCAEAFGIEISEDTQTGTLVDVGDFPAARNEPAYQRLQPKLRRLIQEKLRSTTHPQATALALQFDLIDIASRAVKAGGKGVVVLIDDLHLYGPAAAGLVNHTDTTYGLGNHSVEIPLAFTATYSRAQDCEVAVSAIRRYVEDKRPTRITMQPFSLSEAYLVYHQLLLGEDPPVIPIREHAIELVEKLYELSEGRPGRLKNLRDYIAALRDWGPVKPATSEERLEAMRGGRV